MEDGSAAGKALGEMGWNADVEATIRRSGVESSAWGDVGKRSWWLAPFVGEVLENYDPNSDAMKVFAGELKAEMRCEKANGDALETLKKWLLGEADTLDANMVGEAYFELARCLVHR